MDNTEKFAEILATSTKVPIDLTQLKPVAEVMQKIGVLDSSFIALLVGESLIKYSQWRNNQTADKIEALGLPAFRHP